MSARLKCSADGESYVLPDGPKHPAAPRGDMSALTGWFPKRIKPVRVGLYEVRTPWPFHSFMGEWAYWDGRRWGPAHFNQKDARRYKNYRVKRPIHIWRGLTA